MSDGPTHDTAEDVTVRRNAPLAGAIGALAAVVAILYLSRASDTGAWLDWTLCVAMGAVAAAWLHAFIDARTPLLVADAQGLRVRQGRSWLGMPWEAVDAVEHLPRPGWLRDGRIEVFPREGEPVAVPLSLSTRVTGDGGDLTAALEALAADAAEVVEVFDDVSPEPEPEPEVLPEAEAEAEIEPEPEPDIEPEPAVALEEPDEPAPDRRSRAARVADVLARLRRAPAEEVGPEPVSTPTPSPVRDPLTAARVEVRSDAVLPVDEPAESAARPLVRPGSVDLVEDTVLWSDRTALAQPHSVVEPLVVEEPAAEPAPDPVIGPQLAAARARLGLGVDQLAERTRIRPHVIESIEVDDFAPCGGDFYARGHLRTLARVVGIDVGPLLAVYDERYADAPVDARRVFEAELATGAHGGIRGTRGGPNWSVLVAAVMVLVLAWSVARLLTGGGTVVDDEPRLNGSAGLTSSQTAGSATSVRLAAAGGGAAVEVVDGRGKVVFTGDLAFGQVKELTRVVTPIEVTSSDGSLEVSVGDSESDAVGESGERARKTYVVR
ncbi:helix-turn-helix domain-containing protein [Nocardioides dongkuii]|uniref:helix-turn-helix domain-containing protein n=1 Tax=Nocardioides dongkuii TaxID=2760089 RepID=UPI0015F9785F|nr:helix-turn-helix transcriptional regulator [Nocardioides dongkuii]